MNDLVRPDEVELITLPDGHALDARQSTACLLFATEDMTHEQIAEQAGYSTRAACSAFLSSNKGKMGVRAALTQHLNEGARIGLQAMIRLAKGAKSENVRQLAAADLMNRARLELEGSSGPSNTGGREVKISINLASGEQPMRDVTVDHEAEGESHE